MGYLEYGKEIQSFDVQLLNSDASSSFGNFQKISSMYSLTILLMFIHYIYTEEISLKQQVNFIF